MKKFSLVIIIFGLLIQDQFLCVEKKEFLSKEDKQNVKNARCEQIGHFKLPTIHFSNQFKGDIATASEYIKSLQKHHVSSNTAHEQYILPVNFPNQDKPIYLGLNVGKKDGKYGEYL